VRNELRCAMRRVLMGRTTFEPALANVKWGRQYRATGR
jgi:hypothetical protein